MKIRTQARISQYTHNCYVYFRRPLGENGRLKNLHIGNQRGLLFPIRASCTRFPFVNNCNGLPPKCIRSVHHPKKVSRGWQEDARSKESKDKSSTVLSIPLNSCVCSLNNCGYCDKIVSSNRVWTVWTQEANNNNKRKKKQPRNNQV